MSKDLDDWDKEKAELVENSKVGKILGELADWFADNNRDWDKDMDKHHAAYDKITNLIAQETNKARLDELTWARDMAEKDITGHSLISLNYVNQRIQALTADKEPKNG